MTTVTLEALAVEVPPVAAEIVVEPSLEMLMKESTVEKSSSTVDCIPIKMFPSHVEIEVTKGVFKNISHEEFKGLITRTETQAAQENVNGLCLPSNVFFFAQTGNKIYLSCYYVGGNRKFKYNDSTMDIVVPNIIISHTLRLDKKDLLVETSKYFCTDLPISKLPRNFIGELNRDARVFLLPMSNTYDDGKMCYGHNNMPVRFTENNIRGLDYYYSFLWDTPFNNDLGVRSVGTSSVSRWYSLLNKGFKDGVAFPYSCLRGWSENEYSKQSTLVMERE